jgi:lysozyme family protein
MIGTVADGGIGPNTLKALANYEEEVGGVAEVIKEYQKRRQAYYEGLSTFATFGKGWTRRTTETTEEALKLV